MAKKEGKTARRYARALFNLGVPAQLDAFAAALAELTGAWKADSSLQEAVLNPAIPITRRIDAIRAVAALAAPGNETFANFAALLLRNRRISELPAIREAFDQLVAEFKRLLSLEVISAFELPQAEKDSMQRTVRERIPTKYASLVSLDWKIEKEIIGGLRVRAGDKILDASLSGALDRLARQLRV